MTTQQFNQGVTPSLSDPSDKLLITMIMPASQPRGTFQLVVSGSWAPVVTIDPGAMLGRLVEGFENKKLSVTFDPAFFVFKQNCITTEWTGLVETLTDLQSEIIGLDGVLYQATDAELSSLIRVFDDPRNQTSYRFEFNFDRHNNGELFLRSIPQSPSTAAAMNLFRNNVVSVGLGSIPVFMLDFERPLKIGIQPPFYPVVASTEPITWDSYLSFVQTFLTMVLFIFPQYEQVEPGDVLTKLAGQTEDRFESRFQDVTNPTPGSSKRQVQEGTFFSNFCSFCHDLEGALLFSILKQFFFILSQNIFNFSFLAAKVLFCLLFQATCLLLSMEPSLTPLSSCGCLHIFAS